MAHKAGFELGPRPKVSFYGDSIAFEADIYRLRFTYSEYTFTVKPAD